MNQEGRDWTHGEPTLLYQTCGECRQVWYFRRDFCPHCGHEGPELRRASGRGRVVAVSIVTRAPSAELRQYAPYCIVLVDADEGFRVMGHADRSLAIGDPVRVDFVRFAGGIVPHFRGDEG